MFFSTTADLNTAVGALAMTASGTGSYNTALGAKTLLLMALDMIIRLSVTVR